MFYSCIYVYYNLAVFYVVPICPLKSSIVSLISKRNWCRIRFSRDHGKIKMVCVLSLYISGFHTEVGAGRPGIPPPPEFHEIN